jgi:hypothetical protein
MMRFFLGVVAGVINGLPSGGKNILISIFRIKYSRLPSNWVLQFEIQKLMQQFN